MSLDASLQATFRNYSTLFLVVFVVLAPLHLLYGWIFRDVFEVRELHDAIANFPPARQVRGVGRGDIDAAGVGFWLLVALEVMALPLFAKASAAVLDQDRRGRVTSVPAAWSAIRARGERPASRPAPAGLAGLAGAAVAGLAIATVGELALRMTADFVPDRFAFVALATASATARSCGIPFFAVALASARRRPEGPPERVPDLY